MIPLPSGREEPDPDDELLANTGVGGRPPHLELVGLRGHRRHTGPIQ